MDLKQLRYFVSVAENLSFTDAAAKHFVAQSAISRQISNLEDLIGVQLFVRNKRAVQLTTAGTQLLKEAREVIVHYESAISKARLASQEMSGNIKIGFLGPEKTFLPKLIHQFNKKFPQVSIDLTQFTRETLNYSIKNGEIDIGFTLSLSIEKYPEIQWRKISNIPINVVIHRDHPLADRDKISITLIANEPVVVISQKISPDGYKHTWEMFAKHGFTPNIVKECSCYETVLLMIEAGIGMTILPKTIVNSPPTLCFKELEEKNIETEFIVAWNKNNQNPLLFHFIKEIESFLIKKQKSIK